ncbi:MAG: glycerophosphodiester phosphodiesterase family protein [Patescibacteria group bacterium]
MLVFAHRGIHSRTVTENTLEAFQEAVHQGADGIEFDLRVSKDGELVVCHDANLHRVAGDAHRVEELTLAELQSIALRHGGRIPSLHDVTSTIHASMLFDMELKHADAVEPLIVKLKTSVALRERTIVSSFQPAILSRFVQEVPDVRRLFLIRNWPLPFRGKAFRRKIDRIQPWGIAAQLLILTKRRVRFLKNLGVLVGAWDRRGLPREARTARKLGVDIAIVQHVREARVPLKSSF